MQEIINDFTIHNFQEIDSTNKTAFELIKNNQAFHKHIITAKTQLAGKGRMNRKWLSFGGNLYFSVILQIDNIQNICNYSLLTTCILGSTLKKFQITTYYKWPNDIIYQNKKLSGILLQKQNINKINYLIIGIGLNLKDAPDYAISLKNFKISKMEFLDKFTAIFNQYLQKYQQFGFNVIINEWKNNAYKIGQKITLSNSMTGIFKDIDWQGNLLLQDSSGKINKILSEDVFI